MRKMLEKHEELRFTLAALGLLGVVVASFLTVRYANCSLEARDAAPSLLTMYPSAVVPGATQRVTVLSERTHFGPETSVRAGIEGVYCTNIRFVSEGEMSFDVHVRDRADLAEGSPIPLAIRSKDQDERAEEVSLVLAFTRKAEPLQLDLYNFGGKDTVTVDCDYVMFGYRPKGYAPFLFKARRLETGHVFRQATSCEVEHLGAPLASGENSFELSLSDALGREVKQSVRVQGKTPLPDAAYIAYARSAYALASTYTGKPTYWSQDPTEQAWASDAALSNGPFSASTDWTGDILPPPNDYVANLGQAVIGGDGVLLHNSEYRADMVDLHIPGRGLDFVWKRSYQSGIFLDGYLGKNWDFNWGAHFLVDNPAQVTKGRFSRGDGRRDLYDAAIPSGSERIFSVLPKGYSDMKTASNSSTSQVTQKKRNGFTQIFDLYTGNLKSRADRYGNTITVLYNISGKIASFTDTLGRSITVSYGAEGTGYANSGRITRISDFASRAVTYEYREMYAGGPVVLTKVNYPNTDWIDETGALQTSAPKSVQYSYESEGLLTEYFDGRGKRRVKNVYTLDGTKYRVTEQRDASDASRWTFSRLNLTQVTVTSCIPQSTTYNFDFAGGSLLCKDILVNYSHIDVADPNYAWITQTAATTVITRDTQWGLPTAIQEPDGGYTTFTLSSNGDVTTRREYADNSAPYGTSTSDIVKKAYFGAVDATQFGVVTKIVGPRAYISGGTETKFQITITYSTTAHPTTIQSPNTTNPIQTGHTETRTYNSNGQLLTVARPEGLYTKYTYYSGQTGDPPVNNNGYLKEVKVKFQAGLNTDDNNFLITRYEYSSFGAKIKETDPLLRLTLFTVDNEFLVKQLQRPAPFNYVKKFYYNGDRKLVKEELENRKGTGSLEPNNYWQTECVYNNDGLMTLKKREISQSGSTVTWQEEEFEYDCAFRLTLVKDGRDKATKYHLDERGLRARVTRDWDWAAMPQVPGPDSSEEFFFFDGEEKLAKTIRRFRNDGDSSDTDVCTRIEYDVFDRKQYVKDGATDCPSNYKTYTYDIASMVTQTDQYDAPFPNSVEGCPTSGPLLRQQNFYFDELDRLWKSTRGPSQEDVTTINFDKANRQVTSTDFYVGATRTEYDLASRVTKKVLPTVNGAASGENYETFAHDKNGNVVTRTSFEVDPFDPVNASLTFRWTMTHDELNRLLTTTSEGSDGATPPNPVETVNTYDSRDLVIEGTDPDGVHTLNDYDGLQRLLKTTLNSTGLVSEQVVLETGYDLASNVVSRKNSTQATPNATLYAYDNQNRRTQETLPDLEWRKLTYNQLGLLKTLKYGSGDPGTTNRTLKCRYNALGLLTSRSVAWTTIPNWSNRSKYYDYSTSDIQQESFGYDGLYRLVSATDYDSLVTYGFNNKEQMLFETLTFYLNPPAPGDIVSQKTTTSDWSGDPTGRRRTAVTYPFPVSSNQKKFEFTYDPLDRITGIGLDGTPDKLMADYDYEGPDLEVRQRDRGLNLPTEAYRSAWTDDALERVTQIAHTRVSTGTNLRTLASAWGNGSSGRLLQRSTLNATGLQTFQHTYAYDPHGRLKQDVHVQGATNTNDFTYNLAQFWLAMTQNSSPKKTFVRATDGSEQMAQYTESPNPAQSATYDAAGNRVTLGTTTYWFDHQNRLAFIDGPSTDYWLRYDAIGRLIALKEGTGETLFYYDGLQIIEETNTTPAVTRLNLHGPKRELIYTGGLDGSGNLINHRWPMENHLNSVLALIQDGTSTEQTTLDYTAYGETTVSGFEQSFYYGMLGRRLLGSSGLYDFFGRAGDPKTGRFLGRDPQGTWQNPLNWGNAYAYLGSDPVNRAEVAPTDTIGLNALGVGAEVSGGGSVFQGDGAAQGTAAVAGKLAFLAGAGVFLGNAPEAPGAKPGEFGNAVLGVLGSTLPAGRGAVMNGNLAMGAIGSAFAVMAKPATDGAVVSGNGRVSTAQISSGPRTITLGAGYAFSGGAPIISGSGMLAAGTYIQGATPTPGAITIGAGYIFAGGSPVYSGGGVFKHGTSISGGASGPGGFGVGQAWAGGEPVISGGMAARHNTSISGGASGAGGFGAGVATQGGPPVISGSAMMQNGSTIQGSAMSAPGAGPPGGGGGGGGRGGGGGGGGRR